MDREKTKYLVISPVRNEAEWIETTIISMLNQTVTPEEWIIVDDGSRDSTSEIVERYIDKYAWIKLIHREDRGFAEPGRGIIEAFYEGYEHSTCKDFDFIVKLDGDLHFDETYFESLFKEFSKNPKLGMASGVCYIYVRGILTLENHPEFHVRGPSKIYRRECWKQIGQLVKHLGWDTLDEVKAQYLGWTTKSFKNLRLIHYKVTGYKSGAAKWAVKCGKSDYYCGYHPLFILVKGIKRFFKKPYLIDGMGILFGYFKSYLNKDERYEDSAVIEYLRKEQIKTLMFRRSIWR
jgi:biofilm PGA synthesis N-glycosyltransferase PgaC